MAPYGACEVAQSTARSKAQFEAERFRRESAGKTKVLSYKKEICSKVLSKNKKNMPEQ